MFSCPPNASKALPPEYREAAEQLFPVAGFPGDKGPSLEAAEAFAAILGINEVYHRLWKAHTSGPCPERKYLHHFQNNLDLLIQKTWVEKGDEARKEDLIDKVAPFISLIEKGDYPEALREFGAILEELAYLLFGAQSQKDDFAEYVIRIDEPMGLFWWYGGQINGARDAPWVRAAEPAQLYALLLLGICYLTDF